MLTLTLLAGIWSTTCIQTQISGRSGFVVETYEVAAPGDFTFSREWFTDSKCESAESTDQELGTLKIGKAVSMSFTPNTYEADFKTLAGSDFGVVALKGDKLKVGRGFLNSQARNTMTGVFDYTKR